MNVFEYLQLSNLDKFEYFMDTRFPTNRTSKYFVDWEKVVKHTRESDIGLNTLNYLVGKDNIAKEAKVLFSAQPQLLKLIPLLLATRERKLTILKINNQLDYYTLDFDTIDADKIDEYLLFMNESGLLSFLKNDVNSNLIDYVYGVEVGLDTNARKNRGGTQNEDILEFNLRTATEDTNLKFSTQATASKIFQEWGIRVPEPLTDGAIGGRRYDGAVFNPDTNKVTVIETNYYGGGGSKLKAVCGEFSDIYLTSLRGAPNVDFIWISDGVGWNTAKNPLREAFDVIPNIFNLNMVRNGYLRDILLMKD